MVELHFHTKISDGCLCIEDSIKFAKANGITHLAITDHDTTSGISGAIEYGMKYGIEIIPGIEISGYDFSNKKKAHILGYYVDYSNDYLNDFCEELRNRRSYAAIEMVSMIKENGYSLSMNEVERYSDGSTGIFKQHIMHALIDKGYSDKVYSELYYDLFSSNPDKPGIAYVPLKYLDVIEAVKAVKNANGIAVLAHPSLSNCLEIIPRLVEAGLDGLEAKHSHQNYNEEQMIRSIADYYNLIITGGSDYHGFYGYLDEKLGSCDPGIEIINEFHNLRKKILSQSVL